jgi:chitinase
MRPRHFHSPDHSWWSGCVKAGLVICGALSLLILNSPPSQWQRLPAPPSPQWSTGYWNGWDSPSSDIDWGALTHVIHWAALVNADGTLDMTTENEAATAPALIAAAHANGVQVLLDLNQPCWLGGCNNFQQAVTGNLSGFVNNILNVVNTYGYDGVDIDWEPFNAGANGAAMTSLLTALRKQLGTKTLVAAAIVSDNLFWASVQASLDRVNVMTYDQTGLGNPYSWHNAALYDHDGRVMSVNLAVQRFTASGVPAAKLGIGIPFYGWQWTGGGITGPLQYWTSTPQLSQMNYNRFAWQITSQNYNWDSFAQVPYLSNNAGYPSFLTYDDAQSIAAKIHYAKANSLGGWIIWQISADYFPTQTPRHPLLAAVKSAMGTASPAAGTPP